MKRLLLAFLFLVVVVGVGQAQVTTHTADSAKSLGTLPTTCAYQLNGRVNIIYKTGASAGFYTCKSTGNGWDGPFPTSATALVWGNITGTLSNQTDLQSALDLKANAALSNLASVAINTNLTFAANTSSLIFGSGSSNRIGYTNLIGPKFVDDNVGLSLTLNLQSLSASRTLIVKNENGTICTTGSICTGYAPLDSPGLTGTPLSTTAAADTNTTQIATTAYVVGQGYAKLASPTFTGTPTLPTGTIGVTQSAGNSTTALATTAFVTTADNLKANIASPTFTGTVVIPTPFTLGAVSVTSTGTQLNYLSSATGTTGTTSTNLVFSTSPVLVTPSLGVASGTSLALGGATIGTDALGVTGTSTFSNNILITGSNRLLADTIRNSGNATFIVSSAGVGLGSAGLFSWNSNTDGSGKDTNISRNAAGRVCAGTTAANCLGSVGALNFAVGNQTAPSANNTAVIVFADNVSKPTLAGTLPTAFYNKGGEQYVQDSSANETLLSPHNFSLIPGGRSEEMAWSFFSNRNDKTINVDMLKTVRLVEKLSGEKLVYISGEPTSPIPPADFGGAKVVTPTPGATVTVTIDTTVRHTIASWTSGEIETINISGTPIDGAMLTLIILNDGTLGRVLTAGTGLSGLGIVTGVTSKRSTITYIALSGVFYEVSRTVGF